MGMKVQQLILTVGAIAVIFLLVPASTMQTSMAHVHGFVKIGNKGTNNVTVELVSYNNDNAPDQVTVTSNDSSNNPGYYYFDISNGSGKTYVLYASYDKYQVSYGFTASGMDLSMPDMIITVATPTPIPTSTPTPRPSGEIGGMVIRNDSSSFLPVSAHNPTMTPTPKPSWAPTAAPTMEPTPTSAPAAGILSNVSLCLAIALVAILAIAAATLLFLRK
jgi:hypothetical protein